MALEIMKDDVRIIQGLSDYPNQEEGLTSREMKAKFDEAAVKLQGFINDSVVPAVNDKLSASELSGAVADAVEQTLGSITPDKIGAAPAGYGLGTTGKQLSTSEDLNAVYINGLYKWDYAPVNAPYANGVMLVLSYSSDRLAQVVWAMHNNKFLYRTNYAGTWSDWLDCSPSAFAPAGFGLGKTVKWIHAPETLADYIHSGFYSWDSGVSDAPFGAGSMIIVKRTGQYVYQIAFRDDITRTEMAVRKLTGATWTPWEWINPPMETGVEYRTTEKYNGKAVYVKSVSVGKLTNGTNVKITGVSEAGAVRAMAKAGGYTAPFYSNATLIFGYSLGPTTGGVNVGLYSNGTLDALNVTVTIWYTKD